MVSWQPHEGGVLGRVDVLKSIQEGVQDGQKRKDTYSECGFTVGQLLCQLYWEKGLSSSDRCIALAGGQNMSEKVGLLCAGRRCGLAAWTSS